MGLLLGIIASRGGGSGGSEALPTQLAAFTSFELEFTDGGYIVRWTNTGGGNGAKIAAGPDPNPTDLVATVTGTEYEGTATNGVPIYVRLINKGPGYIDSDYSDDATVTPDDVNVGLAKVIVAGDSTTAGANSGGTTVTDYLDAALGVAFDTPTFNAGFSSKTTNDFLITYYKYVVRPQLDYTSSRNLIINNTGINDPESVAERQTIYTDLVQLMKGDGALVALCSPIHSQHTPTDPPATTGDQFTIDAWMAANKATIGWDYHIRLIQDEFVGQFLTANEDYWFGPDYPSGDGTHYGPLGIEHVAENLYVPALEYLEHLQREIPATPSIAENTGARTITLTVAGGLSIGDYQVSIDGGFSHVTASSNVLTLDDSTTYKVGQAGFRVKPGVNRTVSLWSFNTVDFEAVEPGGLTPTAINTNDAAVTAPGTWGGAAGYIQADFVSYASSFATIDFTKGIELKNGLAGNNGIEFFLDGTDEADRISGITTSTLDEVMFKYFSGDSNPHTLHIRSWTGVLARVHDGKVTLYT